MLQRGRDEAVHFCFSLTLRLSFASVGVGWSAKIVTFFFRRSRLRTNGRSRWRHWKFPEAEWELTYVVVLRLSTYDGTLPGDL
jgi:hypothetical protein